MWELTKSFRFEAAHALPGTTLGVASEEIHGHSFRAEVTVRGTPDPATGMVLDLGLLERSMTEVRKMLDTNCSTRSTRLDRRRWKTYRASSGIGFSARARSRG